MPIVEGLLRINYTKAILLFSMALFFSHCRTTTSSNKTMDEIQSSLVTAQNNEIVCIGNEAGTFTLCHTKINEDDPLNPDYLLKFLVLENATDKVIYQQNVTGGYVKWFNNELLEFYSAPGIIEEGKTRNQYIKLYNVKLGSIISKEQYFMEREP